MSDPCEFCSRHVNDWALKVACLANRVAMAEAQAVHRRYIESGGPITWELGLALQRISALDAWWKKVAPDQAGFSAMVDDIVSKSDLVL